jgi:thymidylate kinase
MSPVHPSLAGASRALDAAGVRWCLLRDEDGLEAPEGDVDLLVAAADLPAVLEAALGCGFVALRTWGRGTHRFLVGYDAPSDDWVRLDVVTDLRFGQDLELSLPGAEGCLDRRVPAGGAWALAPHDAFWLLLLHVLLDGGRADGRRRARLEQLARAEVAGSPIARTLARACPGVDLGALVEGVRTARWDALQGKELREGLARRSRIRSTWRSAANPVLRKATRLVLLRERGMTVALVGPDGVGKSTLTEGIADRFAFPATRVYMGIHRGAGSDRRSRPLPLPLRIPRQWLRYLRGRAATWRGHLVLFDRYAFDARLTAARRQSARRRAARAVLARIPDPDLTVLLDAPAQIVHARKPERCLEDLERLRAEYLAVASRGRRVAVVDASGTADEVRRLVTATIWAAYVRRARRSRPRRSQPRRDAP